MTRITERYMSVLCECFDEKHQNKLYKLKDGSQER